LESIIKTIFFIIAGVFLFFLLIIFLPIIIILYLVMPRSSSRTWFNTFSQQARSRGFRQSNSEGDSHTENKKAETYSSKIPASEDVIDVAAEEIEDKKEQ
jgi:hypothetical protein